MDREIGAVQGGHFGAAEGGCRPLALIPHLADNIFPSLSQLLYSVGWNQTDDGGLNADGEPAEDDLVVHIK